MILSHWVEKKNGVVAHRSCLPTLCPITTPSTFLRLTWHQEQPFLAATSPLKCIIFANCYPHRGCFAVGERCVSVPLSPRRCMQEKALITSVKLAGCLQSALARHSQNLKYFPWDVLVIINSFLCWLLALYCLASNTWLQELLQPPDSAMDNLHLCTHYLPRTQAEHYILFQLRPCSCSGASTQ